MPENPSPEDALIRGTLRTCRRYCEDYERELREREQLYAADRIGDAASYLGAAIEQFEAGLRAAVAKP